MKKNNKFKKFLVAMAAALACSSGIIAINHAVQAVPVIGGYVAAVPDGSREGFKVDVQPYGFTAYTNANGFYRLNNDDRISSKTIILKISKKGYLSRYVHGLKIDGNTTIGTANDPMNLFAGDVNDDDTINMNDIVIMAKAFNTTSVDRGFNDAADINSDKTVNMSDVVIAARNFNKSSIDYGIPIIEGGSFVDPSLSPSPTNTPINTPINTPTPYVTTVASVPATATSLPLVDSRNLKSTTISFNSEEKITTGKNIVFCPTFQMAWDGLSGLVGDKLVLSGDPAPVEVLNRGFSMENSLSQDSYLTKAGFGQNTVDAINKELKERFPEPPSLDIKLAPSDMIAYAYLYKTLSFAKTFDIMKNPMSFDGGSMQGAVKAFGINSYSKKFEDLKKQVKLFSYKSDDDFIIKLLGQSEKDEIILAKVPKDETLYKTYSSVMNRINSSTPSYMDSRDSLMVPVLNFNIGHNYTQLEGRAILNENARGYFIDTAYQSIKFKLDETGAALASEAYIVAPISIYTPKNLVFDSSFMLIMKEKDAQNPYLMLWVDNTELLSAY